MPYVGTDFPACAAGEAHIPLQLDFVSTMGPGRWLASATWTCRAMPNFAADPAASSRVATSGAIASVPPADVLSATYTTFTGGVAGARYELKAVAIDNYGVTWILWSYLTCLPDGAA